MEQNLIRIALCIAILPFCILSAGCSSNQSNKVAILQADMDNVMECLKASIELLGTTPQTESELAQFLQDGKAASQSSKATSEADFDKLSWSADGTRIKVTSGQNIRFEIGKTEILASKDDQETAETHFAFSLPNTPCIAEATVRHKRNLESTSEVQK